MQTNFDDKFEKFSTEIMKDVVKATKLATDTIEITKSCDERLHKIEINQKHMNVKYDGVVKDPSLCAFNNSVTDLRCGESDFN